MPSPPIAKCDPKIANINKIGVSFNVFFVSVPRRGCPKLVFYMADVLEVLSRLSMSKRRDRTFNSRLTAG